EDYAIQRVVELLRESGDQLDEEIKKDKVLSKAFQNLFSYAFFASVADLFLMRTGAAADADQQRAKIALTAEMTSKLTAVDNHPMNRVLGFGAKYLQEHFTPWVQSQGGWERAFDGTEDDDNDEVQ
uniref:Apoptosis facilitator Bcl-2-like protein 14 n=1 Tax=Lepisosteus oculatus TaxID=7918 RepID=W5NKE7_LEPOC